MVFKYPSRPNARSLFLDSTTHGSILSFIQPMFGNRDIENETASCSLTYLPYNNIWYLVVIAEKDMQTGDELNF